MTKNIKTNRDRLDIYFSQLCQFKYEPFRDHQSPKLNPFIKLSLLRFLKLRFQSLQLAKSRSA